MNKLLIVGLGNPGPDYENTRHNIGFRILDALAAELKISFEPGRLADRCEGKVKNKKFVLIKPTTFMNLSGKAVQYHLQDQNIAVDKLMVVTDDIALPFGTIRMRTKGSDGGHNGLKHINETLGHGNYARLRFGIGNEYPRGGQVDYVLGEWSQEELKSLNERITESVRAIIAFGLSGIQNAMNEFNG